MLSEPQVFVLAENALQKVVDQIRDDQWSMQMPEDFFTRGQKVVTLREVINYHAYDDAWVPDMLAGKTMAEVGLEKYKGDLLGGKPKENFANIVALACAAALDLKDLDHTVHCSFGDFKAREYFWQINMFRGLRAHDIAKVIGVDDTLPSDLVQGLWDEISPNAEAWRKIGVFGPAIEVPHDADLMTRLYGLVGRKI